MSDKPVNESCFLDALPVGVIVIGSGGEVEAHNDLALAMLGVDVEALLDDTLPGAVTHAGARTALMQVLDTDVVKAQASYEREGRSYAVTVSARGERGAGRGAIVVITDTTHFRQMEQVKEQFIDTILHKLRGPLATVKTSLSILGSGRIPAIPAEAGEIVAMSHHEVNRLSVLLNDLSGLFSIDMGLARKDMTIEAFSLADALAAAVRDLHRLGGSVHRHSSRIRFADDIAVRVRADFSMCKRSLFYVLHNALLFSDTASVVRIDTGVEEGVAVVSVRDEGPGIDAKDLPHIYTRFYRGDNAVTRSVDGNGLGLYLARSFVEIMGGALYCESVPGRGTVFHLSLPLADEERR
jgi:signal transduction histidine kinase